MTGYQFPEHIEEQFPKNNQFWKKGHEMDFNLSSTLSLFQISPDTPNQFYILIWYNNILNTVRCSYCNFQETMI